MEINKPYRIVLNDKTKIVGYYDHNTAVCYIFRTGLNDKFIFLKKEVKEILPLSPRDIETKKNGKFYTF